MNTSGQIPKAQAFPSWLPPCSSLPCPAHPALLWQTPLPTQPRTSNWPYCQSFFSRRCDLTTMVCFGYVFSLLRDQNNGHFLHLHSETPAMVYRPRGKVARLERREKIVLLYFSIRVFGALKRAACLLFKRLWYSERKKYRQGTVTALVCAPKAGNSLANLKIKYASIKQLSLLDSQSGGWSRVAYIMQTPQCLFFFQKFKKSFFLFSNSTKRFQNSNQILRQWFNHLCSSDLLSFFFFFFSFPWQTLPNRTLREKESFQSINFLMPQEPTFSREDSKWVTSLMWPHCKCHTHACSLS